MNGKRSKKKLGVEQLENRELMAGNVGVTLDGSGTLQIRGDSRANAIEVFEVATDRYRVQGINTTVNGKAFQEFNVRKDAIKIDMGGGDDFVYLHDAVMRSFDISMGSGNDSLFIYRSEAYGSGDSAKVDMGSGDDFVRFYRDYANGNLKVDLGHGDDNVEFIDSKVNKDLSVYGGPGKNTATVTNSTYGKLKAWKGF